MLMGIDAAETRSYRRDAASNKIPTGAQCPDAGAGERKPADQQKGGLSWDW